MNSHLRSTLRTAALIAVVAGYVYGSVQAIKHSKGRVRLWVICLVVSLPCWLIATVADTTPYDPYNPTHTSVGQYFFAALGGAALVALIIEASIWDIKQGRSRREGGWNTLWHKPWWTPTPPQPPQPLGSNQPWTPEAEAWADAYARSQQPTHRRVTRTVAVANRPPEAAQRPQETYNDVAAPTQQPTRPTLILPRYSGRTDKPRHAEDHGFFTIDDYRGFDPELGE